MKRSLVALALFSLVSATPVVADGWHWFNPLGGQPGNDDMTASAGTPSSAVRISSSQPGDLQWYYIGLPGLPAGTEIDSVTVCYEVENPVSFISQVRITRMTTPDAQFVVFDNGTDLVSTDPECVSYAVPNPPQVAGAMTIAFRCDFAAAGDWIEIGGIGIRLAMSPTPVSDDAIAARPGSRLEQNRPNPFNPSTTIRFDLPREQRVEVTVYTVDGKRVVTLHDGFLGEGRHEMVWSGRDDRGRPQASGVYLYRLKTDAGVESRRMTLVR